MQVTTLHASALSAGGASDAVRDDARRAAVSAGEPCGASAAGAACAGPDPSCGVEGPARSVCPGEAAACSVRFADGVPEVRSTDGGPEVRFADGAPEVRSVDDAA